MFAEFDFSAAKRGPQASTFTELFAEVLHPVSVGGAGRPEVGADLHASLTVSFADAVHGVERQVLVTRQVVCGACAGAGQIAIAEAQCRQCQGAGHIRWARGHMVFSKPCGACGGEGRQTRERCAVCAGQGRGVRGEAVSVAVPPGITDGGRLRVVEMGHAGQARRPRRRFVCDGPRAAASVVSPRRRRPGVRPAGGRARSGARRARRRAVARGPGQASDSAGHARGPAVAGQRRRACDRHRRTG